MLCHDCPDLDGSAMPLDWTPRARCCRDEHLDRRLAGDFAPWAGIDAARAASAEEEARTQRRVAIIGTDPVISIGTTTGDWHPIGSILSSEPQPVPRQPGNRAARRKREAQDRRKGRS